MKIKRGKSGFTLMEVMVGIAIVAIISVPLLNMFATSFKVGRYSYNIDNANTVALRTVERIRAGQLPYTLDGAGQYLQTDYFDYSWNPVDPSNASSAVFRTEIRVQGQLSSNMNSAFLPQLVDSFGKSYSILIRYDAKPASPTFSPTITLESNGASYHLSSSEAIFVNQLGAFVDSVDVPKTDLRSPVLPVVVDNSLNTVGPVLFRVTGTSGVELGLFVYGDDDETPLVSISVTGGGASITKLEGGMDALQFDQLNISAKVIRMEDNLTIADYSTKTYVIR